MADELTDGVPGPAPHVQTITVRQLSDWLRRHEKLEVFDVRQPWERETARIEGTRLLDADGVAYLMALDRTVPVVFQCHHGVRSRAAAQRALSEGFSRVFNLAGGIDAWSREIDPSVALY